MKALFTHVILFIALFTNYSNAQWSEQTSPVVVSLNSVSAVDNNVVWVCGASGLVLLTTNSGSTWTIVTSPFTKAPLYCIWGIDANTAVVAGSISNTFVFKTTNGGNTWTQVFTQAGGFIDAITQRITSNKLIMVGNPVGGRWSIWISDNSGSTWDSSGFNLQQAGTETGFINSFFLNPAFGAWFGTNNTRVYRRFGATFTSQPTPGLVSSEAVWFNQNAIGMVGGASLLTTSNSGIQWTPLGAPGSGDILGITGTGNNWWYVRGTGIYYTSNNGNNWSTDYTAPGGSYNHISKSRTGTSMWAVRTNGGISKSSGNVGIMPISNEIPDRYSLHQNFPNPFNPSTSIKFDIIKESFVKLIVYDETGREITRLVNKNLIAGTYEISLDASNFASGIYFYKLESPNFTETKKMVLIK